MPDLNLGAIGQIAIHAVQEELTRRGVVFKGAAHLIYRHPDGTEEWMTFFEEPGGGLLSLMSQVTPAR